MSNVKYTDESRVQSYVKAMNEHVKDFGRATITAYYIGAVNGILEIECLTDEQIVSRLKAMKQALSIVRGF